jgi:hypothetical protein
MTMASGLSNPELAWDSPPSREHLPPVTACEHSRLNISVVYEDAPTRAWAAEVCERVAALTGKDALHSTWWKLSDLVEPAVLAGAVSTALRADVIVVAIRAAEGFPLPFYVWVDSWLPYHPQGTAALVALITLPDPPTVRLDRARTYLRAVARQGRLDFLLEERKLPVEASLPPPVETETAEPVALCPAAPGFELERRAGRRRANGQRQLKAVGAA